MSCSTTLCVYSNMKIGTHRFAPTPCWALLPASTSVSIVWTAKNHICSLRQRTRFTWLTHDQVLQGPGRTYLTAQPATRGWLTGIVLQLSQVPRWPISLAVNPRPNLEDWGLQTGSLSHRCLSGLSGQQSYSPLDWGSPTLWGFTPHSTHAPCWSDSAAVVSLTCLTSKEVEHLGYLEFDSHLRLTLCFCFYLRLHYCPLMSLFL